MMAMKSLRDNHVLRYLTALAKLLSICCQALPMLGHSMATRMNGEAPSGFGNECLLLGKNGNLKMSN
jgi:hypothetical protein